MNTKKLFTGMIACTALISALVVPASAANNTDANFTCTIASGIRYANTETAQRLKQDSSSSYINYSTRVNGTAASGPYQFEAIIYGADSYYSTFVDCSSFTNGGKPRSKAIVTRGSKGLVRQDVYEKFGSGAYGQIWGTKAPSGTTGTAKGCWSVDSVGSYPYYNYVL